MTKKVKELSKEQLDFIRAEFGFNEEQLQAMSSDELYDKVYDPCCAIEEVEIVATLDDDSELSANGRLASEIVTILGEAL